MKSGKRGPKHGWKWQLQSFVRGKVGNVGTGWNGDHTELAASKDLAVARWLKCVLAKQPLAKPSRKLKAKPNVWPQQTRKGRCRCQTMNKRHRFYAKLKRKPHHIYYLFIYGSIFRKLLLCNLVNFLIAYNPNKIQIDLIKNRVLIYLSEFSH